MSTKKATKRALLTSILAICLCLVMLIGSTFAWFTDTASTGVNKIQSGTLDVGLEMATKWNAEGKATEWATAEGKTLTFKTKDNRAADKILWEPGCTYELPELRVVNNGNLALKYKIQITGIQGNAKLNEAITWTISKGTNEIQGEDNVPIGEYYLLPAKEASDTLTIKGHMKDDAGNEYQGLSIEGISVTVYATQYTYEYDSSNNQYDKDAAYKGSQEFTSGTHVLDKGGVALNPNDVAVKVSGDGTNVTITGGYYDGGEGGDNRCVQVDTGATVIIKDGTFTVGGDANKVGNSVILCNGGTVVIEGGFFYTDYAYKNFYYVLNQQNKNPGTITVKGGTFVNYDPSKGDDNLGGNFVADGYSVISEKHGEDTWYTVVEGKSASSTEDLGNVILSATEPTTITLSTGTYTLPSLENKDITIKGTKDTVISMKGDNAVNKATSASFDGVTVEFANENYKGFQHTGKLTYKDCTIKGMQFLYATDVEFINCIFEQSSSDAYNLWTYTAKNVLFDNCVFNCAGKSVLIYHEGYLTSQQTVEFKNCKFKATAPVAGKAAIELDTSAMKEGAKVIIDQATANGVEGFGTGSISKSSVWNNKKGSTATVVVDNVTVLSPTP